MSLVELLVSMGIFTIMAGTTVALVMQTRRIAEQNIYESTAQTAAQGYLEQLKTMTYTTLTATSLPTQPQAITRGSWNTPPAIDINLTPTNTVDDVPFRIRPTITNLSPINGFPCYEIVIDYEYDSKIFGKTRTRSGGVRLVRAQVPTF